MDINKLATVDYAILDLKDPSTGKKSGATITLYSHLSNEFHKAKVEALKTPSVDRDFYQTEILTKATKEIKGFTENGMPLESNEDNIRKLYKSSYIRDEADMFLSDINNFFLKK